mgnify:FL=1
MTYKILKAQPDHIRNLQKFTENMCKTADVAFPSLSSNKSTRYLIKMIEDETALCLVKDKKVVGAVAGLVIQWWFSEAEYLSEMGFWIDKEHRTKENAHLLLTEFKKIADKKMIPCLLNTLDGKEIQKREKLFKENDFRKLGFTYGYAL